MAMAELFPIHQQCQEEEEEATAAKKTCSFVLGEGLQKKSLLFKWKEDDKELDKQLISFAAFRRDLFKHVQIPEEVLEPRRLPSMAKTGPDQLLSLK